MREDFQRSQVVGAAPLKVWAVLLDFRQVSAWITIVGQVEEVVPRTRYRAVLADRLGPFKLRADLEVNLSDIREGVSVLATAAGEDRQVGSTILVQAVVSIRPAGSGTDISVSGHYQVLGRVASLGAASIQKKAAGVLDDFFGQAAVALRA